MVRPHLLRACPLITEALPVMVSQ